jgi:glycosyltransferase involved in cell wall biosynthesis
VGVVVPNPVAVEDFDRAMPEAIASFRQRCHIPPEAYVCGRVGQPSNSKWHPQNVLAFIPIATRDPRAYLLLLGFPASLQPVLDSLREDIRRRVIVLPLTDSDQDLCTFYSSLDCFLHVAQIGESFGLVLTEAMLCGVPVVTASLPYKDNSQVEVVGHLRGGMVAGSVKRVGPAALMMWENDQLREQLGRQARRSVIDRYASDAVAAMALRVGQLALESSGREDLARRIAQQPELRTDVCEEEIARLLADTVGGPDPLDLLKMRLVHNFVVQRGIQRYLDWRYPRR